MKEENTTNSDAINPKLAGILCLVLHDMMQYGTVKLHVSSYKSVYTVKDVDSELVHVDKDNSNGFEWFQTYLIASPTAKMHIKTDAVGLPEVTVVSDDYARRVTYTFMIVPQ